MNNAYLKAQIEQLEMICNRIYDDVERLEFELAKLKAAVAVHPGESRHPPIGRFGCALVDAEGNIIGDSHKRYIHPGESWPRYDAKPVHWHGNERCNCEISFDEPVQTEDDPQWEGIP